jgi:D-sedoheptulose 7-phosphate isomerase
MIEAQEIREYCSHVPNLGPEVLGTTATIAQEIYQAWRRRDRVWTIGNGGSALTAAHFALDLAKGTTIERIPPAMEKIAGVRALDLAERVGPLTAWANDSNYLFALEEQVRIHVNHGDCLIAFSCSGHSGNVVQAITQANELGAITFLFTGPNENAPARSHAWLTVGVDLADIRQVEDVHQVLAHAIAGAIRREILDLVEAAGAQISDAHRRVWSLL